jgi:hypothetical protein
MIKTKNDASVLFNELQATENGQLPSSYPSIYFYNKEEKSYNYLVKKDGSLVHVTMESGNEEATAYYTEVKDPASFLWKNRKHINKSGEGVKIYSFSRLYQTAI